MTDTGTGNGQLSSLGSVKRVLASPNLRRVQLAFGGSLFGDWAYSTALVVWAYTEGGGVAAIGAYVSLRFILMAVTGPLGAVVADRVSRKSFMVVTDLVRAVLVAASVVLIMVDGPVLAVYAIALLAAIVGAPFRAAQAGLIPKLVSHPQELTASNAVASNIENVVCFLGPSVGALLVGLTDVTVVFWLNVATFLWSAALVSAIKVPAAAAVEDEPQEDLTDEPERLLAEISAGFRTVLRDADLRIVSVLSAAQGFIWGALTVFMVILAVDVLEIGPEGVGWLDAILGLGTVLGGVVVLGRLARGRLASDMGLGVLGWSLPMVAIAIFPHPITVLVSLAAIGLADPWVNLGLETIPQRIAPEHVISRVYAAVESALVGAMALGAALAPVLVHWFGLRWSIGAVGLVVLLYTATTLPRLRRLDARLVEPAGLLLLRGTSLFAPLSPGVQERLAHALQSESFAPGVEIIREGDVSDRFYLIRSGQVRVTEAGVFRRDEGAGDFFGEIGLLRDVPRTATVTAQTDVEVLAMERDDFLDAITGQHDARAAADEVISRRLGL